MTKIDFTKLTGELTEGQRLASETFLHSLCSNNLNLIAFGFENFVEFVDGETLYLYSTATSNEFELPLYRNPSDKETEDGELPKQIGSEMPEEYFQFINAIQQNYHLAHCLRLMDLSLFKSMTNWPHSSPQLPIMRKKGEFTARDALPMQIILPGMSHDYHS